MLMLSTIKAVIFDLDGTLIDTEVIYDQAWQQALRDLGYTMSHEQYLTIRSLGTPYLASQLQEWYGPEFDLTHCRQIRNNYFQTILDSYGLHTKPGAIDLLRYLKEKGYTTAVATATDLTRAKAYLTDSCLIPYMDRIISAKMVQTGKPSPDVYLYACKELGFNPEECLAIEDAPNGITAAYQAGCRVIMVPDQSQPDEDIWPMLTGCVESLEQVIALLE